MVMAGIISLLVGMVLGQYFKVFVLVPAFAIVAVAALLIGLAYAATLLTIALLAVESVVGLQIGYLAGALIPLGSTDVDAGRHTPAHSES